MYLATVKKRFGAFFEMVFSGVPENKKPDAIRIGFLLD